MWWTSGGRGFGPDAGEVFEEGLLIPIAKFAERGRVDPLLIRLIRANVRVPDQVIGGQRSGFDELVSIPFLNRIQHYSADNISTGYSH